MQLALYGTLDLSADDTDACIARLASARPSRCASILPTRARPTVVLALALALRTGHALAADPTRRCTSLRITSMIFSPRLPAPCLTHLALPHFVGSLPRGCARSRPPRCVTLRIASAQYDGLHPATLFVIGALGNTRAGLEVLNLSLEGTFDEVSYQALYKKVSSLLPNVQALRTLPIIADEGPSRLALWTRPPLRLALRCAVFPMGAHWELEREEWNGASSVEHIDDTAFANVQKFDEAYPDVQPGHPEEAEMHWWVPEETLAHRCDPRREEGKR
ncbi:hypothetical protein EDB86DRAFT_3082689 [Lactarius hatsudake]|nr:hypothetical protein EDB86DRAFT_3082689 [Lactarius hatsudake]